MGPHSVGYLSRFVVSSNHASDRLIVRVAEPGARWEARLEFANLTAETQVYERWSGEALRLDAYFADLASAWRGWEGDRTWEGLGLLLAARHDGLGHVDLEATLQADHALAEWWRVRATLKIDAGQLGELAREAQAIDP